MVKIVGEFIKQKNSGHFYNKDGERVPGSTLKEARKDNLFPSVTTVMNIVHKEQLEIWKREQILKASIEVNQAIDETEEEYVKRVIVESDNLSRDARDWGKIVHQHVEDYLEGKKIITKDMAPRTLLAFDNLVKWIDENLIKGETEKSLCSTEHRFGGTPDWFGETESNGFAVLDWKTQGVKKRFMKRKQIWEEKPVFYPEHIIQLAAGGIMIKETYDVVPDSYISIVVDSNEDNAGYYSVKVWDVEDVLWGKEMFLSILQTWRLYKKYF